MRVLFVVRPNAATQTGGDLTQADYTKRGLEQHGVEVDVVSTLDPDPRGYDLAHVFGVFDPEKCERQIAACRGAGVPVALSPIWWDLQSFFARSRAVEDVLAGSERTIDAKLARLRDTPTAKLIGRRDARNYAARIALQRRLMASADVLLPNSAIEAYEYLTRLRLDEHPIVVVPNIPDAIEPPGAVERRGVVCVARVEQKKNQAMLLHALRGLDADVTLIGGTHEPPYVRLCERFATDRVRFAGALPRDQVLAHLHSAAVHVLASWAETPGIANLEAAVAGARVVTSHDGTQYEYFGEHALYVDPENPQGIRRAVERALAMPPRESNDELSRRLCALTVETVGRATLRGYALAQAR